jgi:hypothetical protein
MTARWPECKTSLLGSSCKAEFKLSVGSHNYATDRVRLSPTGLYRLPSMQNHYNHYFSHLHE